MLTNVWHQLGSAPGTPGGKFLLAGPNWTGEKPDGFLGVLRLPTNVAGVFPRSFAARSEQSKAQASAVLDQLGMYPLSEDQRARGTSSTTSTPRTRCSRPVSPRR